MSLLLTMIKLTVNINDQKKNSEYKGRVFQIFGFDILIDKNLKSWLLEINDHPSFSVL